MERSEDDQWSWWQQDPTSADPRSPSTEVFHASDSFAEDLAQESETGGGPAHSSQVGESVSEVTAGDPVRKVLIGLVAVLSLGLAGVSYQRWGNPPTSVAAPTTTALLTQTVDQPTTAAPTTETPTSATSSTPSTAAPTTTTTLATTTTSETTFVSAGPPGAPQEVMVISTGRSSAEIRWRSDECVGSRYQVGDFDPGGGGYPDVNRCWFNHVILAGDPAFSPPLEPNTTYTVRIEAIGQDGSASDPVEVQFTTSQ